MQLAQLLEDLGRWGAFPGYLERAEKLMARSLELKDVKTALGMLGLRLYA